MPRWHSSEPSAFPDLVDTDIFWRDFVVYRGFPGLQLQPIILLDESVAHGQWELGLGAVFIVFIAGLFHWAIAAMRSAATRDSSRVPLALDAEAKAVCVAFEVVVLVAALGFIS